MPQALKQQLKEHYLKPVGEVEPKFQAYQEHETIPAAQFQELLFFVRLSAFCLLTVASAFFLLSHHFSVLLGLLLALVFSAVTVLTASLILSKLVTKLFS